MTHFFLFLPCLAALFNSLIFASAFTFSNAPSHRIVPSFSPLNHRLASAHQRQTLYPSQNNGNDILHNSLQNQKYTSKPRRSNKASATMTTKTSLNLTPVQGEAIRTIGGLVLATKISMNGYKTKKSLSKSGAIAAFCVASVSLSCSLRSGMTLLLFYLSSSKLTRLGREIKQKLDDDHKAGVGKRDATQVLSCSAVAVVCAVLRKIYVGADGPLDLINASSLASLGNRLTLAYVAFFACCAGDTWASELGVLSKTPPRLITQPWKVAVPGTNGAVSTIGLLASAGGGLTMGIIHGLLVPGWWTCFLGGAGIDKWITLRNEVAALAMVGFVGGLGGSLLDSLLGATIQATYYDPDQKKISKKATENTERIGGMFAILSNEMVNVVSTTLTALCAAVWAKPLLSWIGAI